MIIAVSQNARKVGEVGMKEMIFRTSDDGLVMNSTSEIELVRCKNCKHSTVSENGLIKCGHTFRTADFYCADGEKKDDD